MAGSYSVAQDKEQTTDAGDVNILFNGKSLEAWRGYAQEAIGKGWTVEDGALHFDGSGGGDIVTKAEFTNFELTFDWKVAEGSNSGVMYRVGLGEQAPYFTGPEYQILDDDRHADGKNPLTSAGSLYGLYAPNGKQLKPVGEWNSAKIVAKRNHIEHWLNGAKLLEAEIGGDEWNRLVAGSKFKQWPKFGTLAKGRICLQDHGNHVWYREIKVRDLGESNGAKNATTSKSK
jgi:hypothetical protein